MHTGAPQDCNHAYNAYRFVMINITAYTFWFKITTPCFDGHDSPMTGQGICGLGTWRKNYESIALDVKYYSVHPTLRCLGSRIPKNSQNIKHNLFQLYSNKYGCTKLQDDWFAWMFHCRVHKDPVTESRASLIQSIPSHTSFSETPKWSISFGTTMLYEFLVSFACN